MRVTLTSAGLSPAEVAKQLEEGRFEHRVLFEPVEDRAIAGSAWAGEIPLTNHEGSVGYLLMERGRTTLGLSLFTCRTPVCGGAQEAAEDSLGGNKRFGLPAGARISDVRYGDANADGQTDVLVVLSTGAGILFEQNAGERAHPPAARPPVPRPARR